VPRVDREVDTSLPPERVREALLDFSDGRPEIWPHLTRELYEVLSIGETEAEIKEGTKMGPGSVWAHEHYDWSDPETIRWTVRESNLFAPGSYVSATLAPRADGGTRIRIHWERTGSTLRGRIICRMVAATKGKPIVDSFEQALRSLEQSAAQSST
jgi:polyketide cyclase/dehydrase/lipid transport protein